MFVNNINPDLVSIGPFAIRFYGIVYALGFLLAYFLLQNEAKKNRIKNLTPEKADALMYIGMISGIIGARAFHVITDFYLYKGNLLNAFAIWKGGLGIQGGIFLAALSMYAYCRKNKINLLSVLDVISVPFPLAIGFGRIANFINSEIVGKASNVMWCVKYIRHDYGITESLTQDIISKVPCRHPASLYQAASQFIIFAILFFLSKKLPKLTKIKAKLTGLITWSFVFLYGLFRFFTDFFRDDYHIFFLGLSHTQLINLVMLILGAYNLFKYRKFIKI